MILHQRINQDFKDALKSGDQLRRSVLAMLKTTLLNKAIEKQNKDEPLDDSAVESIISSEVKKRSGDFTCVLTSATHGRRNKRISKRSGCANQSDKRKRFRQSDVGFSFASERPGGWRAGGKNCQR